MPMGTASSLAIEEGNVKGLESRAVPSLSAGAPPRHKKPGGALSLLRAALFMARRGSKAKKVHALHAEVARSGGKGSLWQRLAAAMRPLHTHQLEHCPPPLPAPSPDRHFHDVLLPPPSPDPSYDGSYASADDVQGIDAGDEEDIDIVCEDGLPNVIDVQAEEFIAKFYQQMKLQRLESISRGCGMIADVERGA